MNIAGAPLKRAPQPPATSPETPDGWAISWLEQCALFFESRATEQRSEDVDWQASIANARTARKIAAMLSATPTPPAKAGLTAHEISEIISENVEVAHRNFTSGYAAYVAGIEGAARAIISRLTQEPKP